MNVHVAFVCDLPSGIHARPASMLAQALAPFSCAVTLAKEDLPPVDARSVLSIVGLDIQRSSRCVIRAEGVDAESAIGAVRRLIEHEWAASEVAGAPVQGSAAVSNSKARALPMTLREKGVTYVTGTPVSRGHAQGLVVLLASLELPVALREARVQSMTAEVAAARSGFEQVRAELQSRVSQASAALERDLLGAHAQIARDPSLWADVESRIGAGATAAQAIGAAAEAFAGKLRRASSAYIRDRVIDVQDVCMQVIERVTGVAATELPVLERESVLIADVLTPNQLLRLDRALLKGLVLGAVGATSHTVIVARSLGIPTIIEAHDACRCFAGGSEVVVDAERGLVLAAHHPEVSRFYQRQRLASERRRTRLAPTAQRPGATRDGQQLEVAINASTPDEVQAAIASGAEGVGLFRTETLFLHRASAPSEDEQFGAYRAVVEAAQGRPVILRTFDIGGDKPAPYMGLAREENPFLGVRGLRLYARFPGLLDAQLRAIVRVSAHGPVKVMAPMVSLASEAAWFRQRVREVQTKLREQGERFDEAMPIGVMVEVPALAMAMDELCEHCDFLSLGTNDLCQYWMAVDRGNASVAPLYDAHNPPFLRLLAGIVASARKHEKWIGICGEMASDPANLPLLVGMGLSEISVAPSEVLTLKAALASLDATRCRQLLEVALACKGAEQVRACLSSGSHRDAGENGVLDPHAIDADSNAASKHEAIREAVELLHAAGRTEDPDAVEEAVWAREQTYSTGLGFGFAVPHCKSAAVRVPSLAVMKLREPIAWGAIDDQPVRVVLLLAIPASDTTGAHMKVFAKLARKLMHEDFRQQLMAATTPEALEQVLRQELQLSS